MNKVDFGLYVLNLETQIQVITVDVDLKAPIPTRTGTVRTDVF